ncbi:hypothetical protein RS022_05050 [Candidatus Phytoplasma rubi]|uniref:DUF2963 domain-containing protein n=1 Tax=Candidatus Phytoplasma rubi TaxID=399025 RepID=A0ABY7BRW0_9MOLU|nr:hypothetical protein [Candidatus Phytoplasma rubi]WAN63390.1 hypothetical protein RS022_05050 [Candidatus Phytoplasma rubi]
MAGWSHINYIIQYNPLTGHKLKQTKYHQNFFVDQIIKYDKATGKEIKKTSILNILTFQKKTKIKGE